MRILRKLGPSFAMLGLALTVTGCDEKPAMKLTMLCTAAPKTSAPNGLSFVFKAEDENGAPITDLERFESKFKVEDGGVTSGGESTPDAIQRPQNVARRTLILIDGSGSVAQNPENEVNIKTAVRKFLTGCDNPVNGACDGVAEDAPANDPRHVVGIYAFYGNNELVEVYGFNANRDQTLSLSFHNGDLTAFRAAWAADRKAMLDNLATTQIAREQTSTALHAASQLALDKLDQQPAWVATDAYRPAVITKSLVLFTDGRDEVNAGSNYDSSREQALMRADRFKYLANGDANGTHSILVAGVRGTGNTIDAGFLGDFASEDSYTEVDQFESLAAEFDKFSEKSARAVQKYYQFNLCSNRRGSRVDATLITPHDAYSDGKLEFLYDASTFRDPSPGERCDVAALQTCDWQDNGSTVPGADPLPSEEWQRVNVTYESPHPYGSYHFSSKSVQYPGAIAMRVHFEKIETEEIYDIVTVTNDLGEEVAVISGSRTNYTVEIPGDLGWIDFEADGSNNGYGYKVDYIDVLYDSN